MSEEVSTEEVKTDKSIVDPARRANMKGASDWIGHFMEVQALSTGVGAKEAVEEVTDEEGKVIQKAKPATKGKSVWDLDAMFLLAERNHIDTAHATFVGIRNANAIGRARMTLHNMLKSRAKKRHGLYDVGGEWVDLPEDVLAEYGDPDLTENRDGTKIPKAKPAKEGDEDADAA